MKTKSNKETNSSPIHVLDSSLPEHKMEAISNLSKAILECSRALNSANIIANISNCSIVNDNDNPNACGIKVGRN